MVRRNPVVRANDGSELAGIVTVQGDVTQPLMGLAPAEYDVVLHCAASLEFDAPEEELQRINVDGTRNALAYAKVTGAAFLHVSTAYVGGQQSGVVLEEPADLDAPFTNRYEASKARAEAAVAAWGAQHGLPFAIARPSIVLGDSRTGAIRDFPSLTNVFRLMARGKVTQFPSVPGATLDLVPIDHVAEGIARLATKLGRGTILAGGIYHLVSDAPMEAAELARGVQRIPHFPTPAIVAFADYDADALRPAERMLAGRMLATFGPYFTRNPRFDDRALRRVTGLACPPTDSAWLDRMIAYAIAVGYLPRG